MKQIPCKLVHGNSKSLKIRYLSLDKAGAFPPTDRRKVHFNQMKTAYLSSLTALLIPSCAPMSNENAKPTGAATAALVGAAAGGIIGHQNGKAAEGAAIGAAAGGLSGWQNGPQWFGGDGSVERTRIGN